MSGNTTITNCRQPYGIVRKTKSHTSIKGHQEDKQNNATSSLFPIEMIAKLEWTQRNTTTKHRLITESHNGSINQQQTNTNRTLERTSAKAAGGLNAFYWYQTFTLDYALLKRMLSSHGGYLSNSMYHHRETIISN